MLPMTWSIDSNDRLRPPASSVSGDTYCYAGAVGSRDP
ncbi:hypothetical protein NJ7G_0335 [Natrinema sp. J7-2]|nr:hypothetical protein NJ7G_0335 [Natrinema sp. J7-2]